jgi:hypothetical protein
MPSSTVRSASVRVDDGDQDVPVAFDPQLAEPLAQRRLGRFLNVAGLVLHVDDLDRLLERDAFFVHHVLHRGFGRIGTSPNRRRVPPGSRRAIRFGHQRPPAYSMRTTR